MTLSAMPRRSWHMARRNVILVFVLFLGLACSACGSKPPPQAAVDAVKSLRKMVGATEIGITYQEYSSRMIDLKANVDAALAQLPDGELKAELGLAMEAYVDALKAWSWAVQGHVLATDYEPGQSLQPKYSIPGEKIGSSTNMRLDSDTTLSIIWTVAAKHVDRGVRIGRPEVIGLSDSYGTGTLCSD